jgi:hypothetical protein
MPSLAPDLPVASPGAPASGFNQTTGSIEEEIA